jgi:HK97 family phage portal protein
VSIVARALARTLERRGADPTLPWGDTTPVSNGMLGGSVAGTYVSEKTALEVAAVYGSVSVLADAVSTLPLRQYRKSAAGPDIEVAPSPVVASPFVEISQQDWLVQGMVSLTLRGNSYSQVVSRDPETLLPTQLKPIHPDHVRVRRVRGAIEYRVGGAVVDIDDMLHVRNLQVPGALVGLNPVEYLRNTIGIARAQDLYGESFFVNSANPSGALSVPGDLEEDEILEMARAWKQAHQGIGAANLPAVLTGGTTWQQIQVNPEDVQFLASRQFSQGEISGMIFRVPPHMIGIVDRSTSWGTGIEQQELGFTRSVIGGYLLKWTSAFNLCVPPGQYVKFDLDARLASDKLTRYQAHMLGRTGGWETIADIRDEEDMTPLGSEYDQMAHDPMAPLNSAQSGEAATGPPDAATQKSPSGLSAHNPAMVARQVDDLTARLLAFEDRMASVERAKRKAA